MTDSIFFLFRKRALLFLSSSEHLLKSKYLKNIDSLFLLFMKLWIILNYHFEKEVFAPRPSRRWLCLLNVN